MSKDKAPQSFPDHVRATCTKITQAEMLSAIGNGGGIVIHQIVSHDDWCQTLKTGRGGECNCNPEIEFYRQ